MDCPNSYEFMEKLMCRIISNNLCLEQENVINVLRKHLKNTIVSEEVEFDLALTNW
jgi:hypothetical protein